MSSLRHSLRPYKILLTKKSRNILLATIIITISLASVSAYYIYIHRARSVPVTYQTPEEKDVYVRFDMEAYDSIMKNYWFKMTDEAMANLFQLSLKKAGSLDVTPPLETNDRAGTAKMLALYISKLPNAEAKKKLATDLLIVATYNLQPLGRNGLLSSKQETELRQTVSNINPGTDLYKNLGVDKGAPKDVVEKAYEEKAKELAKATSTEAKEELKQITYAKTVLTDDNSKKLYDERQIEPTIFGKILGTTLYLAISKISPTTLQEFGYIIDSASTTPHLDSMVIDFRGNIGGSLDFLLYFLGLFIGQNQYAFDLFHQGDYQVQRTTLTKFDELNRFKELAILVDSMSQSTAELTTATFKRLHLAHVVGVTTRGWGTVENTYPLATQLDAGEKYSLLLVNSITLRDDNQPIEGRGVDPDISITDKNWKSELPSVFRDQSLIRAISNVEQAEPSH